MPTDTLSWVQFGDLHIRNRTDENYQDFLSLIAEVNEHVAGEVDFAFLPGDNADDGTEEQYELVSEALTGLRIPVHIITGDHDRKGGGLAFFRQYLEPDLYRAVDLHGFRLLFLNAMDGRDSKTFDLSSEQFEWVKNRLNEAATAGLRIVVFTHLYPSELERHGAALSKAIREFGVELVCMGHTHYNELANDGSTVYEATRSTGQIEEGPPGFSITTINEDVVSWKFKERGPWPFVMITSPADERLITRPSSPRHVVRDMARVRARVWGAAVDRSAVVMCSIDGGFEQAMHWGNGVWEFDWNSQHVSDGSHRLSVRVEHQSGQARDEISVLVNQAGQYDPPQRSAVDYENEIGAYPAKCLLGTQLGPNENGTKGPWPSWR